MKKIIAITLAAALCLMTGCGKSKATETDESTTYETEMTSEEDTTDEVLQSEDMEDDDEAQSQNVENEINITVQSQPTAEQKKTADSQTDTYTPNSSGSPIKNVSGDVYKTVSSDVRAYGSSGAQNVDTLKANANALCKLDGDSSFAQTGYALISSGGQLAEINNQITANSDKISQETKDTYAKVKDDLAVNIEIFLNMDDLSDINNTGDFTCQSEISQLAQSVNSEIGEQQ